jgi:3-oxoacyl-[acyl-carrier protein] reductase
VGSLDGRVAIVTGAARGIGAAVARQLAREGAGVVVHHRTREPEAAALVQELRDAGATATAVAADLRHRDQLSALFDAATDLGGVDIVVNNAGWSEFRPLVEITDGQVDEAMAVNFRAALWTMQESVRHMRRGGRIINVSTLGTDSPLAGQSLYTASKAALEQLTIQGAVEFAELGITVNTVCPGSTQTELFREAVPPELQRELSERSLFHRLGEPSEIAAVIAFLAGPTAGWVTGQRIVVSGGQR